MPEIATQDLDTPLCGSTPSSKPRNTRLARRHPRHQCRKRRATTLPVHSRRRCGAVGQSAARGSPPHSSTSLLAATSPPSTGRPSSVCDETCKTAHLMRVRWCACHCAEDGVLRWYTELTVRISQRAFHSRQTLPSVRSLKDSASLAMAVRPWLSAPRPCLRRTSHFDVGFCTCAAR